MNFFSTLWSAVKKEKTALLFLLKLFILLSLTKWCFFFYNCQVVGGWPNTIKELWQLFLWSVTYDVFVITIINLPLFILLFAPGKLLKNKFLRFFISAFFTILNIFALLLNAVDIFYYRFHLQRADADLLYVLRNPFSGIIALIPVILAILIFSFVTGRIIYKNISAMLAPSVQRAHLYFTSVLLILFCLFLITGNKKMVPTYPLTALKPAQLPVVQNSFHTFLYSLYRKNEITIPDKDYMPQAEQQSLFTIYKKNNTTVDKPRNIILFIMESVPYEFFDSNSIYKVEMPFLDSLTKQSTFFSHAFSYSYTSNKGITSILAGIPTMTDIPLYHSNFVSISHTPVGDVLAKHHYSSSFFIGDNYDDFGFAQCCKWTGIQHYYCMEDIPGYQHMEKHTMGLHDQYVLNFMYQKLNAIQEPFLAVQYNISTHFPNDLPKAFVDRFPLKNTTAPMKTMQYYNDCLQQFFAKARNQSWFNNTVFIFCADHWGFRTRNEISFDKIESFHIPVFIYDPILKKHEVISSPVSQMDILNTILYYAGVKDSICSYGISLKDSSLNQRRTVFTKTNSVIYNAINDEYLLGFDGLEGKAVYCYNYKQDTAKKNDLSEKKIPAVDSLILQTKAYLQAASRHYHKRE